MGSVFLVAAVLNFVWEMAQAYLYQPMGPIWEAIRRCLTASIVDGAMVLLVLATVRSLVSRSAASIAGREYALTIVFGIALAVALEWLGLTSGRWTYRAEMPTVIGVGLVPILQMAVLMPLTLWLTDRFPVER